MNRSGKNPVWVGEIKLLRTDLRRLAIVADASLYVTFNNEIGRQFFKKCLGLLPFGMQLKIVCFIVVDNSLPAKHSFSERKTKNLILLQKTL